MNTDTMNGWMPLDADDLPDHKEGPFLCTNNLNARNAHGRMSHVFLVGSFYQTAGPEGPVSAYDDGNRKLWSLTHFKRIEQPASESCP